MATGTLSTKGEAVAIAALTTTIFVSLHTADPTDTGTFGEVSTVGTQYQRKQVTSWTNTGNNPTIASNTSTFNFTQASANWGTVSHLGYWDAVTGGNFLGGALLTTSHAVNNGDTARFSAGTLTISVG
jgi:hypothetical protein